VIGAVGADGADGADGAAQVASQSEAMSDQARQLEAARHSAGQETAAVEARVRALQQGQC
jgi:hypothetical protein